MSQPNWIIRHLGIVFFAITFVGGFFRNWAQYDFYLGVEVILSNIGFGIGFGALPALLGWAISSTKAKTRRIKELQLPQHRSSTAKPN